LKRKIKICNVLSCLGLGGTERIIYYVAKYIDYSKYEFHIITLFSKDDENDEPLLKEIRKTKAKILRLKLKSYRDFKTMWKFISYVRKNRIDIIHAHSGACEFWGPFLGRLSRIKIVIYTLHHVVYFRSKTHRIRQYIVNHILVNNIFVVSDFLKLQLSKQLSIPLSKIITLNNPVVLSDYVTNYRSITREKLGISPNVFLIGNTSRFSSAKGHKYLINIASQIIRDIPNTKFLIIANNNHKELHRIQHEKSLKNNFITCKPTIDIIPILQSLDLFLMTSLNEGFGMVLIEAMAARIPIIAPNIGPIKDIISDNINGLLPYPSQWKPSIDIIKTKPFVNAINFIYQNPDVKRSFIENGYKHVKQFDIKNYTQQLFQRYNKLIS